MGKILIFGLLIALAHSAQADSAPYSPRGLNILVGDWHYYFDENLQYPVLDNLTDKSIKVRTGIINHLQLFPQQQLLIGISNIKFRNRAQLYIFDLQGSALVEMPIKCGMVVGQGAPCWESVTNYREWYLRDDPDIDFKCDTEQCWVSVNPYHDTQLCEALFNWSPQDEEWQQEMAKNHCNDPLRRLRIEVPLEHKLRGDI